MTEESKGKDKKEKKECHITPIKYSMFFINLLVMLAGLAIVHFGVLWYFRVSAIVDFTGKTSDNLSFLFMGIGIMVALVSYLGSFGAVLENAGILIFFKFLLILLFIGKIGCIVLLFVKKDLLDSTLEGEEEVEEKDEEGAKWNENYQWVVTGILGALGGLEIIVIALSIVLTHHIKTCPKHKGKKGKGHHDDEGDDNEDDDHEGEE